MKRPTHFLSCLIIGAAMVNSCTSQDDFVPKPNDPEKISAMELHFDNRYGTEDLQLGKSYSTASNEQITVSNLAYFISNVELIRENGTIWQEPNSYHLVQVEDQEIDENFKIKDIPAGNYTKIRFMLGVDSVRNQSLDLAVGDLKQNNHMTWMWNTGYVFMDAKGTYQNQDSIPTTQVFSYIIGKNGRQRMVELDLPGPVAVNTENNPKVHLHADVKKIFGGPNVIQIKNNFHIDGSPGATAASHLVADNFASMFKIESVQ